MADGRPHPILRGVRPRGQHGVHRGPGKGSRGRVRLGAIDVLCGRPWWPPRAPEVGPHPGLPVGPADVRCGRPWRAPRAPKVGPLPGLPVGRSDVQGGRHRWPPRAPNVGPLPGLHVGHAPRDACDVRFGRPRWPPRAPNVGPFPGLPVGHVDTPRPHSSSLRAPPLYITPRHTARLTRHSPYNVPSLGHTPSDHRCWCCCCYFIQ